MFLFLMNCNFANLYIFCIIFILFLELIQNTTIEERVVILENQVPEIEEDVTRLDQDVNFVFDEQAIQHDPVLFHEVLLNEANG